MDQAKRYDLVKQAQQMVYDANAYIIYEYYDYLQAYRSDRYTDFTRQPTGDGPLLFQYGIYSYLSIRPVDGSSDSSSSSNTALIVGGVAAAAVLVGVVVWLATRGRRSSDSDVE